MTTNLLSGTKGRIRQGQQGQHLLCARQAELAAKMSDVGGYYGFESDKMSKCKIILNV